jgi:hypothetical protein
MTFLTTCYKKDGYQSLLGLLKTFEALQTIQFQWSLFLDFMNKNNNKITFKKISENPKLGYSNRQHAQH